MKSKYVIIISRPDDLHAQVVSNRVSEFGVKPVILDSADFPNCWSITLSLKNGVKSYSVQIEDAIISQDQILGVWARRIHTHTINKSVNEKATKNFYTNEAKSLFNSWLTDLDEKVINPSLFNVKIDSKFEQLKCASEVGLKCPDTIMTNSIVEAEEFIIDYPEHTTKAFTGHKWALTDVCLFDSQYFNKLDYLFNAPIIFQEKITKKTEIIVNIVDNKVFASKIVSNNGEAVNNINWRLDSNYETEAFNLPEDINKKLVLMMTKMGLRFGCFDLAIDENGEYIFFEINPEGQFLFCEIFSKQEISKAIAEALTTGYNTKIADVPVKTKRISSVNAAHL